MDESSQHVTSALVAPSGWGEKSFYDLAKITSGQVDPLKPPYSSMILVAPDHIRSGSGRINLRLTAAQQGAISGKYLVQKGEVIYSKIRPNLQKLALASEECLCSADMYPVAAKEGVSAAFLKYLMLSAPFTEFATSVSVRSGMPKINRQELAHFSAVVPDSYEEQEAIAEALSDADALIEGLERLIAKKRLIKQGAMQDLLTAKRRLPGFAGEWTRAPLRQLCSQIQDGTHFTPTYVEYGTPFYSVENVTARNFDNCKYVTPEAHEAMAKRCRPTRGDILMTRIGSIGDTYLVDWDHEASIYVSLCLLRPGKSIDARYLYAYSRSSMFVKEVEERSLPNAIPKKINLGDIADVNISIPIDPAEQAEIASVLNDMDDEIQAFATRLEKARQVKEGMMQNLLTGRIRLV